MKTYPVCLIGMQARHAVVVGGGRVAARKVKDLLEAGGHVTVISPKLTPELQSLVDDGQVTLIRRPYRAGDLSDAFLVIAATDDGRVNRKVWHEAEQVGCLVNVVDDPTHCNFIMPAVVRHGDVTVAVSTGGDSPALARRLRERLEQLIGPEYGQLASLLAELRPHVQSRYQHQEERRRAALRLVDSDLIETIKHAGMEAARARARELLSEDEE
jgi:precorrin-2 dehydrogenase/sirohydrochlorin ferrochelatase